ncbi:MAG: hypothetical protein SFU99_18170 [Saprospiraceae bacterium]|nr:hypothetical protein [Saprospiraceae bacterium]
MGAKTITILAFFAVSLPAFSQKTFDHWLKKKEDTKIEPFIMLQLWGSYSLGQEVFSSVTKQYEPVDDRFNIMFRRARLGFRAAPYEGLQFTVMGAYDLLGRDVNSASVGGANNGSQPVFFIWDAFLQWKVNKSDERLNIIAGYFRPQISRESITSAWAVNSMEKAMSQNYIRTHLVGTGPGRAVGLNLGGLLLNHNINYNIGIFNPVFQSNSGNSTGKNFAPLLVGRLAFNIGEPEMENYKIAYDINYFNERKGVTLATGGAWQGNTDLFTQSYTYSVDALINLGAFNLDGEWNWMWRDGIRTLENQSIRNFTSLSETGHIRAGYNIILNNNFFIEPSFMLMQFSGAKESTKQADAKAISASSGSESTYDTGINWYLNKKNLKIALHYTWRDGDPGDAGDGATVNAFFNQSDVGAIRRGDWLGLGLSAIF